MFSFSLKDKVLTWGVDLQLKQFTLGSTACLECLFSSTGILDVFLLFERESLDLKGHFLRE